MGAGAQQRPGMSPRELKAAFSLAGIFGFRMLGLFMVLPVFTLHAGSYSGYSPTLAGIAIGAYGLTQALFQIPVGLLSDRIGRRRVILAGLVVFALGSVVAALADSMAGVILGRALQGMGAIGAAVLALAADLTRDEHRTKAMAIIGISIGLSFALAIVLGPALTAFLGMPSVFWSTAIMAVVGMAILTLFVPDPEPGQVRRDDGPALDQIGRVLRNSRLLRLDLGIAALHLVMTAIFVALPMVLKDSAGLPASEHWIMYLVVLPLAVVLMAPIVRSADRPTRQRQVFLGAIAVLGISVLGLALVPGNVWGLGACLVAYFAAFNVLEASLPSTISRAAPAGLKGTALGVYSTCQYMGVFLGGALGGWTLGRFGPQAVFLAGAVATVLWLMVAATAPPVPMLSERRLKLRILAPGEAHRVKAELAGIPGVAEVALSPEDGIAHLKVDHGQLDSAALEAYGTTLPG